MWALLPGVAEPRCIFSKVTEKRFPSKNEVISRLADALKVRDLCFPARKRVRASVSQRQDFAPCARACSDGNLVSILCAQANMALIAPMCEYVAPRKPLEVCRLCQKGKLIKDRCEWCGSVQFDLKNRRR